VKTDNERGVKFTSENERGIYAATILI